MNIALIPEFAVLGHPNEGKSSVVSTLAEDDSVKVSPTPGETLQCRVFPVRIDGKEVIRFTDTPGFQLPKQTLKWIQDHAVLEKEIVREFMAAHKDNPDFKNELELFSPLERGAGIIFVVDGSRPIRNNDIIEMKILRLTGCPRIAVINSKGHDEEFLESWKNEFRKNFNSVRVFNAHNANYAERIALLESLKAIDQDWQPALEKVIEVFKQDWKNRNIETAEIISELLVKCLRHTIIKNYSDASDSGSAKEQALSIYQQELVQFEKNAYDKIRRLFKHNIFQVDLPDQSILNEPLFAKRTWQVLGLTPMQLAAAGAVSGGIIGAGLDLAASGLTFGIFTALGSAIGAGSALIFGEQISKAKVIGMSLGGFSVGVGPSESVNFPYVLLDRALINYSYIINWAHGRRDYPDRERLQKGDASEKTGFTFRWDSGEKSICQSFVKAIKGDDPWQLEASRKKMVQMLLLIMEKISNSRSIVI